MKLLAVLTSVSSVAPCLEGALAAARSLALPTVEVLYVVVDPRTVHSSAEEADFQWLREVGEGTAQSREMAVRKAFGEWRAGHPSLDVAVEWKEVAGEEDASVKAEASRADVVIVAMAGDHNLDATDARHAAIFGAHKPLLVLPPDWRPPPAFAFRRVALGISRGAAAEHALRASEPILKKALEVVAIHVGTTDAASEALVEALHDLDVPVTLKTVPERHDVANQLIEAADEAGADLLVIGAYRHSEVLEWALRSTTRQILRAADLPLLLVH